MTVYYPLSSRSISSFGYKERPFLYRQRDIDEAIKQVFLGFSLTLSQERWLWDGGEIGWSDCDEKCQKEIKKKITALPFDCDSWRLVEAVYQASRISIDQDTMVQLMSERPALAPSFPVTNSQKPYLTDSRKIDEEVKKLLAGLTLYHNDGSDLSMRGPIEFIECRKAGRDEIEKRLQSCPFQCCISLLTSAITRTIRVNIPYEYIYQYHKAIWQKPEKEVTASSVEKNRNAEVQFTERVIHHQPKSFLSRGNDVEAAIKKAFAGFYKDPLIGHRREMISFTDCEGRVQKEIERRILNCPSVFSPLKGNYEIIKAINIWVDPDHIRDWMAPTAPLMVMQSSSSENNGRMELEQRAVPARTSPIVSSNQTLSSPPKTIDSSSAPEEEQTEIARVFTSSGFPESKFSNQPFSSSLQIQEETDVVMDDFPVATQEDVDPRVKAALAEIPSFKHLKNPMTLRCGRELRDKIRTAIIALQDSCDSEELAKTLLRVANISVSAQTIKGIWDSETEMKWMNFVPPSRPTESEESIEEDSDVSIESSDETASESESESEPAVKRTRWAVPSNQELFKMFKECLRPFLPLEEREMEETLQQEMLDQTGMRPSLSQIGLWLKKVQKPSLPEVAKSSRAKSARKRKEPAPWDRSLAPLAQRTTRKRKKPSRFTILPKVVRKRVPKETTTPAQKKSSSSKAEVIAKKYVKPAVYSSDVYQTDAEGRSPIQQFIEDGQKLCYEKAAFVPGRNEKYKKAWKELENKQRAVHKIYLPIETFNISYINEEVGFGLFAKKPIGRGYQIGEYAGEIVEDQQLESGNPLYAYELTEELSKWAVDAEMFRNHTAYMNDSKSEEEANVSVRIVYVKRPYIIFTAKRDIAVGEELRYYYGPNYWPKIKKKNV